MDTTIMDTLLNVDADKRARFLNHLTLISIHTRKILELRGMGYHDTFMFNIIFDRNTKTNRDYSNIIIRNA